MRVLIVDDSAFMRKILKEMIQSDPSLEVIDTARDGLEGVEKAINLKPDLITMDIEMPRMNGIDALREIMARCTDNPPAVLMCSSLTAEGSAETLNALRIGASDYLAKDPQLHGKDDQAFKKQLLSKLRAIGGHRRRMASRFDTSVLTKKRRLSDRVASTLCTTFEDWVMPKQIDAIVIGSSTGGPPILEQILSDLPETLPFPILIAQHMPKLFTESFAKRLNAHCACGATLATHGSLLSSPRVYLAEGGSHLKPTRITGKKLTARTIEHIDGASYKPSVDLLFTTAAELFGPRVLAVQLTGMGDDGAIGAKVIRQQGGSVIAQNSDSCVVYGMPRAVVENGSANAILSPSDIRKVIQAAAITTDMGGSNQNFSPRKIA